MKAMPASNRKMDCRPCHLPAFVALCLFAGAAVVATGPAGAQTPAERLAAYDVVWDSPSRNPSGSMPLGNGDIGINAWVEEGGDLVFYVSKTDAWDENGRLCKVGRLRVKCDPVLTVKEGFRQRLKLSEGVIVIDAKIQGQPATLRLWVDAKRPVVRVEVDAAVAATCRAEVELWRLRERPFGPDDDSHSSSGLSAQAWKPTVLPDVLVPVAAPQVLWYHRNTRSVYELGLKVQHLESLIGKFADPLLNRAFGASLRGDGFVADGKQALKSAAPATHHALALTVLTEQAATPEQWLAQLEALEKETAKVDLTKSRQAHEAWWRDFWDRSWIFVEAGATRALPIPNTHAWRVGVDSEGGSKFGGTIGGAWVHGKALAPDEIARLAAGKPADGPGLMMEERIANACTVAAWIKPAAGEAGRILDRCTVGKPDGMTFDTHPGMALRWIVGEHTMVFPNCLKPGEWQHVTATADAGTGVRRIYLNGKMVLEELDGSSADVITRGYVLQRFMFACSGQGGSPIKFNGSIFTVEKQAGASPVTSEGDPDWRQWGGNYWFQNTRLAYWPMLATGDFDMMEPWFRMYLDALPLGKARVQSYYKFSDAAVFPETMYFWGLPNNGDYGWGNTAPEPANGYIRRYWSGSLELVAVMLDRYDFTQDPAFAKNTLVPLAAPLIAFLDEYWQKRDANGKIIMDPAQSLETFHVAVNPMPEIAGLRFLLPRLLALPENLTDESQRARWTRILKELPPIPVADVGGSRLLRPAESFSAVSNSENPELYAVFPFRLYGVGRPDLEMARATYDKRTNRQNRGWCQDSIQAACLGLADEAGRLVAARAAQINPNNRFPAFWGPNFDWIPDQDHGANILTTLQRMLLQSDGTKLYVLPAWPKDWNVSFKLHAPNNTTVAGEVRGGKVVSLTVTPQSRAADVINLFGK